MPKAFHVRELTTGDSMRELTNLLHSAYANLAAHGLNYTATNQSPEVTARRCAMGRCLIAEAEGELIGTLTYHNCPGFQIIPTWFTRDMLYFEQFGVLPEWQGQGVGKALLDEMERDGRAKRAPALACDTAEPAVTLISLYQRWGFEVDGHVQWDGKLYRSVWLVKWLHPRDA